MSDLITQKRLDRLEDVIEKLTEISADLNKMLAVQEQRLSQQEKSMGNIEDIVERRRKEYDKKLQNVYDVMGKEDTKILDELEKIRKEQKTQHTEMTNKITALEKIIWLYLGGFSVIIFLISYGPKVVELVVK